MPWGFAAAAVGAIGGALISADASGNAADQQAASAAAANATQAQQAAQARADYAPTLARANVAADRLSQLLGLQEGPDKGALTRQFTGADLQNDPGYKFGLQQGQSALQNSAAARGGLYSGAAAKALDRYSQDYAGTKFNEASNRDLQNRSFQGNQLASVAGLGQTALSGITASGQNAANQIGQNTIGAGNAQAAAQLSTGSAYGNAFNQIGGAVKNAFGGGYGGYGGGSSAYTNNSGSPANYQVDPYYSDAGGFA